jgi:hypothetical protein
MEVDNSTPLQQDNSYEHDDIRMDDNDDYSSMHTSDLNSDLSENPSQKDLWKMFQQLQNEVRSSRNTTVANNVSTSSRVDNSNESNVMISQSDVPYLDNADIGSVRKYKQACNQHESILGFKADRNRINYIAKRVFDRIFESEPDVDGISFNWRLHEHISSEDLCIKALRFLGTPNSEQNVHKAELLQHSQKQRTLYYNGAQKYENLLANVADSHDKLNTPLRKSDQVNLIKDFKKYTAIDTMDDVHTKSFFRKIDEQYNESLVNTFPVYVKLVCNELQRLGTMYAELEKMTGLKSANADNPKGKDQYKRDDASRKRRSNEGNLPGKPEKKPREDAPDWINIPDSKRCPYCGRLSHVDKTGKPAKCILKDERYANKDKATPWSKSTTGKYYLESQGKHTLPMNNKNNKSK